MVVEVIVAGAIVCLVLGRGVVDTALGPLSPYRAEGCNRPCPTWALGYVFKCVGRVALPDVHVI
jgi:hypothetical protein